MPIPNNDLASFNRSQFSSLTVVPSAKPNHADCAAPVLAVTQTSWLLITIFGAAAVDGVLSTVVVPVTVPEDVDVVAVVATVLLSAPYAVCDNILTIKNITSEMIYFTWISPYLIVKIISLFLDYSFLCNYIIHLNIPFIKF